MSKSFTFEEILSELDGLKNYFKLGKMEFGVSLSDKKKLINKVNKIKRMIKSPRRIEWSVKQ